MKIKFSNGRPKNLNLKSLNVFISFWLKKSRRFPATLGYRVQLSAQPVFQSQKWMPHQSFDCLGILLISGCFGRASHELMTCKQDPAVDWFVMRRLFICLHRNNAMRCQDDVVVVVDGNDDDNDYLRILLGLWTRSLVFTGLFLCQWSLISRICCFNSSSSQMSVGMKR